MKSFYLSLCKHPGVGFAFYISFIFPLSALANPNDWRSAIIIAIFGIAVVWLVVIKTVWDLRSNYMSTDNERDDEVD